MLCPSCASEVLSGANFCPFCGTRLPEFTETPESPVPPDELSSLKIPSFSMPPPPPRPQPEKSAEPASGPESEFNREFAPETEPEAEPLPESESEPESEPVLTRGYAKEPETGPDLTPEPVCDSVTEPDAEFNRGYTPESGYGDFAPEPVAPAEEQSATGGSRAEQSADEAVAIEPAPDPEAARESREPEPTPREFALPYPESSNREPENEPPPGYGAPGGQWGQPPSPPQYRPPFIPPYPGAQPPQGATGYGYASPPYGASAQYGEPPRKKSNTLAIIGIAAACVLVIIAGIVLAYMNLGGAGSAKAGFDTYDELITAYFAAFQNEDADTVAGYFLPEIIKIFESDGYTRQEAVEYLDSLYGDYGLRVKNWEKAYTESLDVKDTYLDYTDVDASKIQDIKSVEVELTVGKDNDVWYYFFEVVKLDGKWYLIEIW